MRDLVFSFAFSHLKRKENSLLLNNQRNEFVIKIHSKEILPNPNFDVNPSYQVHQI